MCVVFLWIFKLRSIHSSTTTQSILLASDLPCSVMVLLPVVHLSIKLPLRIRDPTLSTIEPHPPSPTEIRPIESSFIFEDPLEAFAASTLTIRIETRVVNLHDQRLRMMPASICSWSSQNGYGYHADYNVIYQLGPGPGGGLGPGPMGRVGSPGVLDT